MNGEVQLSIDLVKALKNEDVFQLPEYIELITFEFKNRRLLLKKIKRNYGDWQTELLKRHFNNAIIVLPNIEEKEWQKAGFVNVTRQGICTDYGKKKGLWISTWEYNEVNQKWSVHYKEHERMLFAEQYCLELDLSGYQDCLSNIADLAHQIEEFSWETIFREAKESLNNESLLIDARIKKSLAKSSVFGGMGSWNDSPPYSAHQKNLSQKFELLTSELYEQRNKVLMMLINGRLK